MLEREGRANGLLVAKGASRLRKPGSFPAAILQLTYGGALTVGGVFSVVTVGTLATSEETSALLGALILMGVGLAVLLFGIAQLAPRVGSGGISDSWIRRPSRVRGQ
jgi:hypothetical protein